ncbi:hypothetical protein GCM10010293_50550 [Streptomyces griseoflavus]|nr:hypothetical protein GCM10010293_50550 [Streptomyces griseoflavus]
MDGDRDRAPAASVDPVRMCAQPVAPCVREPWLREEGRSPGRYEADAWRRVGTTAYFPVVVPGNNLITEGEGGAEWTRYR